MSPQFVAAVLAIDLEKPILSTDRSLLLSLVPATFKYTPLARGQDFLQAGQHPDPLTKSVIASLQGQDLSSSPTKAALLANLQAPDPIAKLRAEVRDYATRVRTQLAAPASRKIELERLRDEMLERRRELKQHDVFHHLDETGDRLFPLP